MNEQAMRFRVGVFVLAMLILLGVLVVLFGRLPTNLLHPQHEYTLVLTNAEGVAPGTPVVRAGVRIGEVRSLKLDEKNGKVLITIAINPDHPLYTDDDLVLTHGLLGGDTAIEVVERKNEEAQAPTMPAEEQEADPPPADQNPPPPHQPLPPGSTITGRDQAEMRRLINQASRLIPPTEETLDQIRKSLERFDAMAPNMERAIEEYRRLAQSTREMIPELRRTNDEIRELAKASRETIPSLQRAGDEVGSLAKSSRELLPDLRRTNDEIQVTARNWGKLGERIDVLLQTNQDKLIKTLDNLNDTVVRIGNVFSDENQRNLNATLKNVRASSESLNSMTKDADDLVKDSRETVHRVNGAVAHADDVLANLQQATKPLAERSGSVIKNLDESTSKLNLLLDDFRGLFRGFGQGDGTLQRFLNDPSLYNNLNEAACLVVKTMPRADRILHDVEVFADKIARHPESLGVGGAIRPSSGLKEAPTAPYYPDH
ncbi:MAG: MCE family protein [Planctomycetes bacterium]|nr:MCE family protein [Planctomycetota bacterium]